VTYEVPVVGGRARGRQRPRAPRLEETSSGHKRQFSLKALDPRSTAERERSMRAGEEVEMMDGASNGGRDRVRGKADAD